MVVNLYAKRSAGEDFEKISRPIKHGMWLDASSVDKALLKDLIRDYALDTNIVYDVLDRNELPRLEFSRRENNPRDLYVFLRQPRLTKTGHIAGTPMLCLVKNGLFFTFSTGKMLDVETIEKSTIPTTTEDTQSLLLGVIVSCIAQFESLIAHTSRSIADTANRLKTHDVTNQDFIHFVVVEDNLNSCKLNLESTLTVIQRLSDNQHGTFNSDSLEALDDICLHIEQLLRSVVSYSQSIISIRNAYSTIANNKLNQRMKMLTVFTVLITLPNVFYGMFGMNVALPFADAPWAYTAIVGFTIVLTLLVYAIGKKLKVF